MLKVNKMYNMDCMDFLKSIDDKSVNLICTSPPYNLGIDYDSYDDHLPWDDYLKWCWEWLKECYRILKEDGRICINHYISFRDLEKMDRFPIMDIRNIQEEIGFNCHRLVIWEDRTLSKLTAWGSWLSASAPYFSSPYEGILISYKDQWKRLNKGESTISKEEFMEGVSGVWKIPTETKGLTKANFSVKLPERCINLLTYKGDIVVDPFSGSGSTAIASIKTERNWICGELSSNYCNIANKRIENYTNDKINKKKYKTFF